MLPKKKIILTFDLEFWYNSKFLKKYLSQNEDPPNDYVRESVEPILNLLKQHNQKVTFFVLGQIAERHPELIKKIFQSGHEIASHGYSHTILSQLGKDGFEREIEKTNQIIEQIIGQKPTGFRAPNFSLNNKTKWAFDILKKHGFKYDSSIHPFSFKKNFQYSLKELPPSLGGIYFRAFPFWFYLILVRIFSKTDSPVIYLHPHELFDSAPRIESAPRFLKKIKYWGTKSALDKFEKLLKKFKCISIKEHLNESTPN